MLIDAKTLYAQQHNQAGQAPPRLLYSLLQPVGEAPSTAPLETKIPGAQAFDIEAFSDPESEFPHTLLGPAAFEEKLSALGVHNEDALVVYDTVGVYAAPRLWFNLTLMGCESVQILNGGLPQWAQQGYPTVPLRAGEDHGNTDAAEKTAFRARYQPQMLATKESVLEAISDPNCRIVDVRSAGRFDGLVPEPRAGLRSGHIPNSVNIPFAEFIADHAFKSPEALRAVFESAGCAPHHSLIFSCGSGVTACIGYVAAWLCGYSKLRVYDGSWAEWGSLDSLPIEKHIDHNA